MNSSKSGNSKRGVSLVEEICAVCILVIGVIAALSLVGAGRTSILTDDTQEGAAASAQKLTDTLITYLSKKDTAPSSSQFAADITTAAYCGSNPAGFSPTGEKRQYIVAEKTDGASLVGYDITARAYYNGGKNYVQMLGFASAMADCFNGGTTPVPTPPGPPSYNPTGSASGLPFILYGIQYGNNWVANNPNDPNFAEGNHVSDYPIVFGPIMQNTSGKQSRNLSAPSIFFLGGDGGNGTQLHDICSIYAKSASQVANLKTNFVYIASKALAFQKNTGDQNDNPEINLMPLDSSKPAYIFFAKDCEIIQTDSIDHDYSETGTYTVVKRYHAGLYTFTGSQNIWSRDCNLTPVNSSSEQTSAFGTYDVNYIVSTWKNKNLVSGEISAYAPNNPSGQYPYTYRGAAGWTNKGVLQSGNPSAQTGKDVYMYVNDYTTKWGHDAQTYTANQIAMQIIDPQTTLKLPDSKTVTMNAGTVALNIQNGDGDPAKFTAAMVLEQSAGSKFIVNAGTLVLFHDLSVKSSDGNTILYQAKAGKYNVKGGSVNLLDPDSASKALVP